MKGRKWNPEEKLVIVLEGLKDGSNVAELCRRHGISQTYYYHRNNEPVSKMAKQLVKEGYRPTDISRALDISRCNCYADRESSAEKEPDLDEFHLEEHIKGIAAEHPFWGYRRISAWLRHREGHLVNHKRIYRLMKKLELLVKKRPHKAS